MHFLKQRVEHGRGFEGLLWRRQDACSTRWYDDEQSLQIQIQVHLHQTAETPNAPVASRAAASGDVVPPDVGRGRGPEGGRGQVTSQRPLGHIAHHVIAHREHSTSQHTPSRYSSTPVEDGPSRIAAKAPRTTQKKHSRSTKQQRPATALVGSTTRRRSAPHHPHLGALSVDGKVCLEHVVGLNAVLHKERVATDVVRNIVGHAGVVGSVHRHSTLEPVVVAVVNLWVCMHTQLRTERLEVSAALRGGARPARKQ